MHILYATDGSEGALAAARFLNALSLPHSDLRSLSVLIVKGATQGSAPPVLQTEQASPA